MKLRKTGWSLCAFFSLCVFGWAQAECVRDPGPEGAPLASIDLATAAGLNLVDGEWRYSDVRIVETDFFEAGPDGQPGSKPNKTYDFTPHAGARDFDDSDWPVIGPETLSTRRSGGKLSFNWYRVRVTIPEDIGDFDPRGTTVVFATSIDDYAEIWVDGELPRLFGQCGGSMIEGWNAPNRLVIGRNVQPGQTLQLAIFGINGPISQSPTNYIFMRYARLEFHPGGWSPMAVAPREVNVTVARADPRIDRIVPKNPKLFKLAEGFTFTEGPVWTGDGLLFSDPNANRIYRYTEDGRLTVFHENSGYAGEDVNRFVQPGSNGLTLDEKGRVTVAEHGNRRVTRLEPDGTVTVLASAYQGKRLNSPNDLVYRSDGALYFTDPPFGLPGTYEDPEKELPFSGVFRVSNGAVELLAKDLKGPNGLAFSPGETHLYAGNWDPEKKVVMRYPVAEDGTLGMGEVFFDLSREPHEEAIDGVKVDVEGNVYVAGPGGLWIVSPEGRHLGTVVAPRHVHNFAWGGRDGKTLYLAARNTLYRMPLLVEGIRPAVAGVGMDSAEETAFGRIERLNPRFDENVPPNAQLEVLAEGFHWLEGPAWNKSGAHLLFSDIPANAVYRWDEGGGTILFMKPSGYSGDKPFTGREPGSNGLTFDPQGRLILCQHGDRRITRLEADGRRTVLVDAYRGKRLNSPNDAVFHSDGSLYFTDPPFGLPHAFDDPAKELDLSGVYRLSADGELSLLVSDLKAPNGIAFSPDQKTLYLTDVDPERPAWLAYPVREDGTLGEGRVFHDAKQWRGVRAGGPDGIKVDIHGNVFGAGPEAVYVFAPDGTHLGSVFTGVPTGNVAWGDDGSALYITADSRLLRIRLTTTGLGF